MKKLVCILTVLLCLCAFAVPCFAADADVIYTVQGEQKPDENVVVNVYVSKDSSLCATDFYVIFPESDLKFVKNSAIAGAQAASLNPLVTATQVAPGKIKVSYACSNPLEVSASICRLEFRALRTTSTPVKLEVESAATYDGEHIRALTTHVDNTRISITQQPVELSLVAIFVIILVVGIIVVIILIKKQTGKTKKPKEQKAKKKK